MGFFFHIPIRTSIYIWCSMVWCAGVWTDVDVCMCVCMAGFGVGGR